MKKYLTLVGIVLALSVHAAAQTAADRSLITVSGQAEVMVVPDEVAFNLKATSADKDLLSAQAKNDDVVKKEIGRAHI